MRKKILSRRRVHRNVTLLMVVSALLVGASFALLLWRLPFTEDIVLLHYNVYFGVDLSGPWHRLLFIPGGGALIWLINMVMVFTVDQMNRFHQTILFSLTVLLEAAVLLATFLVVLLNVS